MTMSDRLAAIIQLIADLDRSEMIRRLEHEHDAAQGRAGLRPTSGRRIRRRGPGRSAVQKAEARVMVERINTILYFLRFETPADGVSESDLALCHQLKDKLHSKGQW
jgi:hypothetical protein